MTLSQGREVYAPIPRLLSPTVVRYGCQGEPSAGSSHKVRVDYKKIDKGQKRRVEISKARGAKADSISSSSTYNSSTADQPAEIERPKVTPRQSPADRQNGRKPAFIFAVIPVFIFRPEAENE